MYTSYTSKLNEFKNRDLILKSLFVEAFSSQRVNINEIRGCKGVGKGYKEVGKYGSFVHLQRCYF
uniref:Uncharacterized protein n=1 Tax=Rhizophagus irregularis (strain DAOM 181602 / DAOM 197198 / MUCL 43194) TaxID=747089 RepID=U9T428_RHIID